MRPRPCVVAVSAVLPHERDAHATLLPSSAHDHTTRAGLSNGPQYLLRHSKKEMAREPWLGVYRAWRLRSLSACVTSSLLRE